MKLNIDKQTTIGEIHELFNGEFEFLKLGFFVDRNSDGNYSASEEMKNHKTELGSFAQLKTEGELEITGDTVVQELEKTFSDRFGLDVQIFHKSASLWLVTTKTDNWTLAQHNQKGKDMANPLTAPEPTDYQELD